MPNVFMKSPTYGKVTLEDVARLINDYYQKNKHFGCSFDITIGTDSQNFSDTKVVSVIAARCVGHGGIYFYEITHVDRITNVKMKLNFETQLSLQFANGLIDIIEDKPEYEELYLNSNFVIHVDAGRNEHGKTKELIPEIVGWIKACGFECIIKPDSYTASSIADRISK